MRRGAALLEPVQVGGAEVFVRGTRGQHLVRGDEDLVADGHRGPLGPPARPEAVELVPEITALALRGRHRGLPARRAQMDVAPPYAGLTACAIVLVVASTAPRPGRC